MINRVSIFELRDNLALYLRRVEETETPIIVERRNKPVAVIKPYKKEKKTALVSNYYLGFLGKSKETGEEFVNRVRRNKFEAERTRYFRNP